MITHAREDVPLQTWLNRNINKKVIEKFRDALEVCVSILYLVWKERNNQTMPLFEYTTFVDIN